jgi:phenylacetate-CoA ligase
MADDELAKQFYDMLQESQWWSADAIRNYQRGQLSQLLRHARTNVPFYESRLDPVFKGNDDIDWSRWSEIPIVTRKDMREHHNAMQARELPAGHGPTGVVETSGSSGVAISITTNRLSGLANDGLRWRSQGWNLLDWSLGLLIREGDDPLDAAPPLGKRVGIWGPPWDDAAQEGYCLQINKLANGSDVLALFQSAHLSYLNTGPKTAHTLALDAVRLGLEMQIEAVLCQGEAVGEEDREIAQRVFGARLIEHYSSKEAGQIAHTCPRGHLHINSEVMFVEVVDRNGQACAPGEKGRLIVTPLYHTAQPLIRYEQGDWVTAGWACSCGRQLPVLESVAGRELAMFHHPDGRAVVQVLPPEARRALYCHHMQIAQVGANDYEVRFVPQGAAKPDQSLFLTHFRRVFFDDARVVFVPVEDIPLTAGGKALEYINEWRRG